MKMIKNSLKTAAYASLLQFSGLLKISFLVGSQMIWFSASNCIIPLSGAFGGLMGAGLVFLVRQLLHFIFFKTISLSFLTFCIPGFFASLYWTTHHYIIRLLLPLLCIGFFGIHSVGSQVIFYSLYWLIPIVLYFIPQRLVRQNFSEEGLLFLQALGSTFIAHAVGSVIWLYTMPMTATMYVGLMPIVLCERILFALGMVIAHHIFTFIFGIIENTNIIDSKSVTTIQ